MPGRALRPRVATLSKRDCTPFEAPQCPEGHYDSVRPVITACPLSNLKPPNARKGITTEASVHAVVPQLADLKPPNARKGITTPVTDEAAPGVA